MSVHDTLRVRLREALKASHLPLKAVADRSGYTPGYVRAIAGRSTRDQRNPTIGAVWAIAGALGVDPLWLLGKECACNPTLHVS